MTYGIVVWGSTFENLLNPVSVAQEKVSRAMTFSEPTAHSSPLFYDLNILKLDDLHQLSISVFAYECQNNIAPLYFVNYFTQTTNIHSYNTRSAARGDFFILQKKTLCSMSYDPSVSMQQRSGIVTIIPTDLFRLSKVCIIYKGGGGGGGGSSLSLVLY